MNTVILFSAEDGLFDWLKSSATKVAGFYGEDISGGFSVLRGKSRLHFWRYDDLDWEYEPNERAVLEEALGLRIIGVVCAYTDAALLNEYFSGLEVRPGVLVDNTCSKIMPLAESISQARKGLSWYWA